MSTTVNDNSNATTGGLLINAKVQAGLNSDAKCNRRRH